MVFIIREAIPSSFFPKLQSFDILAAKIERSLFLGKGGESEVQVKTPGALVFGVDDEKSPPYSGGQASAYGVDEQIFSKTLPPAVERDRESSESNRRDGGVSRHFCPQSLGKILKKDACCGESVIAADGVLLAGFGFGDVDRGEASLLILPGTISKILVKLRHAAHERLAIMRGRKRDASPAHSGWFAAS